MKLTIFAASGGIGRQLLEQAVAARNDVTAVVRNPQSLPSTPARVVVADLAAADPAALQTAVSGADAVLSGLGARTKADAGVAWKGTKAVTGAMQAASVRRVVVVSAAPIGTVPSPSRPHPPKHDPGDGFLMRHLANPLVKAALREHYADLARMEEVLRDTTCSGHSTSRRPSSERSASPARGARTLNVSLDEHRFGGLRWIVLRGPDREAFRALGKHARDEIAVLTIRIVSAGSAPRYRARPRGSSRSPRRSYSIGVRTCGFLSSWSSSVSR